MRSRGMTLIELVMIIAVGSALLVGVIKFTQQQILNGSRMRDYLIAANLAKLKMAVQNNTAYASLPAAGTLPAEASLGGFISQIRYGTIITSGVDNLKPVFIDVDYTGGSFANPVVTLVSYREDHVTFGDGV